MHDGFITGMSGRSVELSFKGGCAIDSRVTINESLRSTAAGASHEIIIKTATRTAGLAVDLARDL